MAFTKVEGNPDYVKDPITGIVLNINTNKVKAARIRKKLNMEKAEEIDNMKKDISEIKNILSKLVEKIDG